jgi:hypothetical protein
MTDFYSKIKSAIPDYQYPKKLDKELKEIYVVLNSLLGIVTYSSCSGHEKEVTRIFFKVNNYINEKNIGNQGLFLLLRCIDPRYWKYGNNWKISVSINDLYDNYQLPISYLLESKEILTKRALNLQLKSLKEKINYYLNNKEFLDYFNINIDYIKHNKIQLY